MGSMDQFVDTPVETGWWSCRNLATNCYLARWCLSCKFFARKSCQTMRRLARSCKITIPFRLGHIFRIKTVDWRCFRKQQKFFKTKKTISVLQLNACITNINIPLSKLFPKLLPLLVEYGKGKYRFSNSDCNQLLSWESQHSETKLDSRDEDILSCKNWNIFEKKTAQNYKSKQKIVKFINKYPEMADSSANFSLLTNIWT